MSDSPTPHTVATIEALQATIENMARTQEEMALHIRHLETNYRNVLNEMVDFQRTMARQDQLMQGLIEYLLAPANGNEGSAPIMGSTSGTTGLTSLASGLQVPLTPASLTASILSAQNGSLGSS